jgi:hypothetical protein
MLAGANGVITLSIPLQEGRQQRKPMSEIKICNKADWQKVHWRTLQSVYNRSPYFEFYKKELQNLYTQPYDLLVDFSMSSIDLLAKLLGKKMEIELASEYQNNYPNAVADIRTHFRSNQYDSSPEKFPTYYQIFEERLGFLPNLSMLDLLFSEAKNAPQYLPKLLI